MQSIPSFTAELVLQLIIIIEKGDNMKSIKMMLLGISIILSGYGLGSLFHILGILVGLAFCVAGYYEEHE